MSFLQADQSGTVVDILVEDGKSVSVDMVSSSPLSSLAINA